MSTVRHGIGRSSSLAVPVVRRLVVFGLLFVLVLIGASGVAGLLERLFTLGTALAGSDVGGLARSLAFGLVGGCMAAVLWWLVWRRQGEEAERSSIAWWMWLHRGNGPRRLDTIPALAGSMLGLLIFAGGAVTALGSLLEAALRRLAGAQDVGAPWWVAVLQPLIWAGGGLLVWWWHWVRGEARGLTSPLGGAVWWRAWQPANRGGPASAGSAEGADGLLARPAAGRRIYLVAIFGISAVVALIALLVVGYQAFEYLLDPVRSGNLVGRIRSPLGLLTATALVAAYHHSVWRRERGAPPADAGRTIGEIVLVTGSDPVPLLHAIRTATGADVTLWLRSDQPGGPKAACRTLNSRIPKRLWPRWKV